jgi:hypothetical protein
MRASVEQLEASLGREFETHPLAPVLRSAPGLGAILAARVLAEVGHDPDRFTTANGLRAFAGTAPVTRASGRSLRKGSQGPQQTPRRRLPLVGLRRPHLVTRCPSPLRPTQSRRRTSQRRTTQPRQQTHRTHVVVHHQRPALGRARRLARIQQQREPSCCLTPDRRGMSMSRPGPGRCTSLSSPTPTPAGSSAGGRPSTPTDQEALMRTSTQSEVESVRVRGGGSGEFISSTGWPRSSQAQWAAGSRARC